MWTNAAPPSHLLASLIPSCPLKCQVNTGEMGTREKQEWGEQEACLRTPQIQRGMWLHSQKDAHASLDQELQHCQTQKAHDPMATEGVRGGMGGGGQWMDGQRDGWPR